MALTELIYVSTLEGASEQVLADILESSIRNNQADGLTGMLLYYRGGFMQVLEGEDAAVSRTFARIQRDKRHHSITMLSRGETLQRHFGQWSMGFKNVNANDLAHIPTHAPFFNFGVHAEAIKGTPGLALELLTLFSKNVD